MNTQIIPYSPFSEFPEDNSQGSRENISRYLYYWPLFVLSILTALAGAFIYLRFADNEYEIKAKVLIKDDKKVPDEQAALKEITIFKDNKAVENEIEILRSRKLMQQVVEDLNLQISYSKAGIYPNSELYTLSPVRFNLLKPSRVSGPGETFFITIKDRSGYILERPNGERKEIAVTGIPNNLGMVIRSNALLDFEAHVQYMLSNGSKPNRNAACPCGSGEKYKSCCGRIV